MVGRRRAAPSVSVIVPVRGRRPELTRLMAALSAACLVGEVIVVENPVFRNRAWLEEREWPFDMQCLVTEGNQAAARNVGAARAQAPVLLFLDSDAVPQRDSLDALVERVAMRPNEIVAPLIEHPPGSAIPLASAIFDVPSYSKSFAEHALHSKLTFRQFVSCVFAMDARVFARVGGFATSFPCYGYEDVEFAWRAECAGASFSFAADATVWHLKQMTPRDVFERAQNLGRSAAHFVQLHPAIEEAMPLGVRDFLEERLWYPANFPVRTLIAAAEKLERAWVGASPQAQQPLRAKAEAVYGSLARVGRFLGIADAFRSRSRGGLNHGARLGIVVGDGNHK